MAGYEMVLRGLHRFFDLCETLDLRSDAEQGRFGIYESRMRHLIATIEALESGRPRRLLEALAPDLAIYAETFGESLEIIGMLDFLHQCPPAALAPMLRRVLKGPVLAADETFNSNDARNIQFELLLGTVLTQSGMTVELAEPDLRCHVGNISFFVACKRIWAPNRLNERIDGAIRQLQRELTSHPEAGGIIAISVTRQLTPTDGRPIHIASRAAAMELLSTEIEAFIARYCATWSATREAQGILFHTRGVFTNHETGTPDVGSFILMHGESPLVEAIAKRLCEVATNS
jgi:hypothetical protein